AGSLPSRGHPPRDGSARRRRAAAVMGAWAEQLVDRGMSPAEAHRKEALFAAASSALEALSRPSVRPSVRPPDRSSACFVPGRVELLGKHTDYAGGRSLVCAVERGLCFVASAHPEQTLEIKDALSLEQGSCRLDPDLAVPEGHW